MSLYSRLTSPDSAQGEVKIPIHAFCSCIYEHKRGYMTGAEFIALFNIDQPDVSALTTLGALIDAAPNKIQFMRVFKDLLYLAESNLLYTTQGAFVTRLQNEVVDQGGTP